MSKSSYQKVKLYLSLERTVLPTSQGFLTTAIKMVSRYTVGAQLDSSVLENIQQITQWESLKLTEGTAHHLKEEVGEFPSYDDTYRTCFLDLL